MEKTETKAPEQPPKKSGDDVMIMKSYGVRFGLGGKKVYGGGGIFCGVMPDGSTFRMVPGNVRPLPKQVIDRYNQASKKGPIFVPPGSQKPGEEIKEK